MSTSTIESSQTITMEMALLPSSPPATFTPLTREKTLPAVALALPSGGAHVATIGGGAGREVATDLCSAGPTTGPGIQALALSPDGRFLAFECVPRQRTAPSWTPSLFLLDLSAGTVQHLADQVAGSRESLAWSPDGRYLAYQHTVDIGPAPVGAQALWVYDVITDQHTQLDEPRHFAFQPVWTLDGAAVVYVVGSWQHSTAPVVTYRAPLDGSGGVPWLQDVQALVPGPAGQWLGVREPREEAGHGQVLLIQADGTLRPLSLPPVEEEYPLGWLGGEPVVWRLTFTSQTSATVLGEVWLAGAQPRRLVADVPPGQTVAMAGMYLLYAEQWNDPNLAGPVWLVDLTTGQRRQLAMEGRMPVALRAAGPGAAGTMPVLPQAGTGGASLPRVGPGGDGHRP